MPTLAGSSAVRRDYNPEPNKGRDIGIIIACVFAIVLLLYLVAYTKTFRGLRSCRLCGYNVCTRQRRSTQVAQNASPPNHVNPALLMQLAAQRDRQTRLEKGLLSTSEVDLVAPIKPYAKPSSTWREGDESNGLRLPPTAVLSPHRERAMRFLKQKPRQVTFALPNQEGDDGDSHQDATTPELDVKDLGICCSICLEIFHEDQSVRVTPCTHEFHSHCLEMWLTSYKNRCPLCQTSLGVSENA